MLSQLLERLFSVESKPEFVIREKPVPNAGAIEDAHFFKIDSKSDDFTIFASDRIISALKTHAGVEFEDIQYRAQKVFDKCKELGFWHGEKVNFLFNAQDMQREPSWTACKIVPPMMIDDAKVDRSIVVFLKSLEKDINNSRRDFSELGQELAKQGRFALEKQYADNFPVVIRAKYQIILSHEFIHVFATDEYKKIMNVLGLAQLELLTDSINFMTFYNDYRSANYFEKGGFAEGAGYLVNLLRAELKRELRPDEFFELLYQRARKIVRECQQNCLEANILSEGADLI